MKGRSNKFSMRGVTWGSKEFDDIIFHARHAEQVEEERRKIDELIASIETVEGHRYLVEAIQYM